MNSNLFTPDRKLTPYWWETAPRPALDASQLPSKVDVAIIGSGYTGLSAALQIARGGRSTLVVDAEDAGFGCSTRNGGQISTSIKPEFEELAKRHGPQVARDILIEGRRSLQWVGDFVQAEKIDCDFDIAGRFHAAHSAKAFAALAYRISHQPKGLEVDAHMVPRAEQRTQLGSDAYYGGAVYAKHASLDPARYHQGLLERVLAAGVTVIAHCPVTALARDSGGFRVTTARGTTRAREVVVATNGYTGALTPWLRRRVIPIGSYMIATEPLAEEQVARLFPRKNRVHTDTRKVVFYYRASPDRRRVLFGGRVSGRETDPVVSGPKLHTEMVRIFPELANARISHSWCGFIAYTFDDLLHIGQREGLHYAMGYCGSGVGMASYIGMRLGRQVLGLDDGRTAFHSLKFQTRPLYFGHPWFLAPAVQYYRWLDRLS